LGSSGSARLHGYAPTVFSSSVPSLICFSPSPHLIPLLSHDQAVQCRRASCRAVLGTPTLLTCSSACNLTRFSDRPADPTRAVGMLWHRTCLSPKAPSHPAKKKQTNRTATSTTPQQTAGNAKSFTLLSFTPILTVSTRIGGRMGLQVDLC